MRVFLVSSQIQPLSLKGGARSVPNLSPSPSGLIPCRPSPSGRVASFRPKSQPLSLWERVAEGRVRAPQQPCLPHSVPYPAGQLIWAPSPQPSPRGRGGRRAGCLPWAPSPQPSPRGRGGRRAVNQPPRQVIRTGTPINGPQALMSRRQTMGSTSAGLPALTCSMARRIAGPTSAGSSMGPSAYQPMPLAMWAKSGGGASRSMPM